MKKKAKPQPKNITAKKKTAAKGKHNNKKTVARPFPIVAIGASAGGIEAVNELLENLPGNTGMAFVYIQHLDPTHESMLTDIMSKVTKMPVMEAKDKMRIMRNSLYIIPPNKEMYIAEGVLRLNARPAKPIISMPINRFFMSLAERQNKGAIGIVLSGNASDGALGLKAIKGAGGITFAQDSSAQFKSMPRSAIAEGAVDMVLSPAQIAHELENLSKNSEVLQSVVDETAEVPLAPLDEMPLILNLLRENTAVDFSLYKPTTIHRRIIRRMLLLRMPSLKEYYKFLRTNKNEISVLYGDLLINVTSFFRDTEAMEYLKKNLLPRIIRARQKDEIRIWVPACSTGEEAYSIAMLLHEIMGDAINAQPIHIFATDLSEAAINKARLGVYSKANLDNVSEARIKRFFSKTDSSYRIIKSVRDMCIFAPHNIFKDPPFSRIDLISCCNLLIYLDSTLQRRVVSTFHYALRPGGFLMVGKSESIGSGQQMFSALDKKVKVYASKKDHHARATFDIPSQIKGSETERQAMKTIPRKPETPDLEKRVDNLLLSQFIPASVVINEEMDILMFRGRTGLFLEPAPGRASLNLLKMARSGLSLELRNAVHKAIKTGEPVTKKGMEISYKNSKHHVGIEVVPLKNQDNPCYLVVFDELPPPVPDEGKGAVARDAKDKRIKQLEEELSTVREDMRSIIEEQEAVNEELQSANEEVVSSNEELQSINEELETSKEEVESTNEELMTMNSEMQMRNDQLSEAYDYADAVLSTLREALLVLDHDFRVVSANNTFYRIFKEKEETTVGVLIYELGLGQWNLPQLKLLLQKVIPQNSMFENYEVELDFPRIGKKILILNGRRLIQKFSKQERILLAIEDTTHHALAQRVLKEREEWIRNIADNAPMIMWTSDTEGRRDFFNKAWQEYTGKTLEQAKSNNWQKLIHADEREGFLKKYYEAIKEQRPFSSEYRLLRADGEYRWVLSNAKPSFNAAGTFEGLVGSTTEIHDQRNLSAELEKRVEERTTSLVETQKQLEDSNAELSQFAYVASHDLQEPLRKITTFTERLKRKLDDQWQGETKDYFERIVSASERMSRLIDDLLNFSRLTTEKVAKREVDLNIIYKEVVKDFDLTIQEQKIELQAEKLPTVFGAGIQMQQLFHNLLSNAIKFKSDERPLKINISCRVIPQEESAELMKNDKKYYDIAIKDNGIGFNADYAEKAFVIFQRLNSDRKKYPGTGIGLALCKKIVTNHAGTIYTDSEEGKGATFHVVLPVMNSPQQPSGKK